MIEEGAVTDKPRGRVGRLEGWKAGEGKVPTLHPYLLESPWSSYQIESTMYLKQKVMIFNSCGLAPTTLPSHVSPMCPFS